MKKLVLITVALLFCGNVFSQDLKNVPEPNIDSMLVDIDKSTFTSPFLYERTTPTARLNTFNNLDRNIATKGYFDQALNELYKSSNEKFFVSYKDARKIYELNKNLDEVNIGLINAQFQSLNFNEEESKSGLRFEKNKFSKVNNKRPFLDQEVLVIAPLLEYAVGSTITYVFNSSIWFEETNNTIQTIVADFDAGTKHTIYNNGYTQTKLNITYAEIGYKTLTFTVTYSDGTIKTTYGKLHVKFPEDENQNRMTTPMSNLLPWDSTISYQGYDETSPVYGKLEYRVFYGNSSNLVLKPIIIIDGFDPEDKRKIIDADSPMPAGEHNSVVEMMFYGVGPTRTDIIEELTTLGYDVVIVNHPTYTRGSVTIDGGADYIERNAMNHVSFYQEINSQLQQNGSNEELVVVGPSMGGQISRYALAYMEKHNIDHNTRLWVSIDSPHVGANIPIGIQSMINLLDVYGDNAAASDFYYNQLKSTAAQQQLIEQHKSGHVSDYLNEGSPVYQQYYNNLYSNGLPNSNGYPQNLRKVAIVNGSIAGVKNGIEAQEDFRIHGFLDGPFSSTIKVTEMNTTYMHKTGYTKTAARFWRQFKPTRTATYTNANSHGSMDVVSGGFFNSEDQIHNSIIGESLNISNWSNGVSFLDFGLGLFGIFGDHFESRTNRQIHTFIPTVSALGISNDDFDWGKYIDYNLFCDDIPFDSFYAPLNNEAHTSFTNNSVQWLLGELAGNPQSSSIRKPQMRGSESVFVGNTKIYSIPDAAKATSYVWNIDVNCNSGSPWQILSGQGTSSITVKVGSSPCIAVISCRPRNYSCGLGSMIYKYVTSTTTGGGGGNGEGDPCEDAKRNGIKSYPNPIKNGEDFTLVIYPDDPCDGNYIPTKMQTVEDYEVKIFDLRGFLVYSKKYNTNIVSIKNLDLSKGLYIINVIDNKGSIERKTIVVK